MPCGIDRRVTNPWIGDCRRNWFSLCIEQVHRSLWDLQCIESVEQCGITALRQLSAAGNTRKLERCVIQRSIELVGELPSYDSEEPESEEKQDDRECSCVPESEPPANSGD